METVERLNEVVPAPLGGVGESLRVADVPGGEPASASASGTVADDEELTDAIIRASRALVGIAVQSLSASDEEVTLPQYRTLVTLTYGGGRRLADLASSLGVSPSTATRMCDRLVRKGLITRTRDEIDRREVNLEVTPAGRQIVEGVIERRRSDVGKLLKLIPRSTRNQLVESLNILASATDETPEVHWSLGWHE
ncbi:MAG TPA: MarR family transcriptional regulator [Acidimicrobiales bacterium]|nr:MarR family transcriptional regulator [Acidimicrobiales bacterium]